MHYFKIDNKPAVKIRQPYLSEKKSFDLDRIISAKKKANRYEELTQSYNSDALVINFDKGCCVKIDKQSNFILRYSADIHEDMPFPISPIFFLVTLGIWPVYETAEASVRIQVVDKNSDTIIKEYQYHVDQKFWTSWLSLLSATFLWGDQWDLAMFNGHTYPQQLIVNRFEKDFYNDVTNKKIQFESRGFKPKKVFSERYAILPVLFAQSKDKNTSMVIRDKIETVLVNLKYTTLERTRMNEIAKEFKLSQNGLTRSDQIEIGKMLNASHLVLTEILELNNQDNKVEFSVKNIEIESGQIVWKHEFIIDESRISESINESMESFEEKILKKR